MEKFDVSETLPKVAVDVTPAIMRDKEIKMNVMLYIAVNARTEFDKKGHPTNVRRIPAKLMSGREISDNVKGVSPKTALKTKQKLIDIGWMELEGEDYVIRGTDEFWFTLITKQCAADFMRKHDSYTNEVFAWMVNFYHTKQAEKRFTLKMIGSAIGISDTRRIRQMVNELQDEEMIVCSERRDYSTLHTYMVLDYVDEDYHPYFVEKWRRAKAELDELMENIPPSCIGETTVPSPKYLAWDKRRRELEIYIG